jgi:hypothetical protein
MHEEPRTHAYSYYLTVSTVVLFSMQTSNTYFNHPVFQDIEILKSSPLIGPANYLQWTRNLKIWSTRHGLYSLMFDEEAFVETPIVPSPPMYLSNLYNVLDIFNPRDHDFEKARKRDVLEYWRVMQAYNESVHTYTGNIRQVFLANIAIFTSLHDDLVGKFSIPITTRPSILIKEIKAAFFKGAVAVVSQELDQLGMSRNGLRVEEVVARFQLIYRDFVELKGHSVAFDNYAITNVLYKVLPDEHCEVLDKIHRLTLNPGYAVEHLKKTIVNMVRKERDLQQ